MNPQTHHTTAIQPRNRSSRRTPMPMRSATRRGTTRARGPTARRRQSPRKRRGARRWVGLRWWGLGFGVSLGEHGAALR